MDARVSYDNLPTLRFFYEDGAIECRFLFEQDGSWSLTIVIEEYTEILLYDVNDADPFPLEIYVA